MKKKLAAAVLSAVMMMSLFAGCGSQETTGSGGAEGETTTIQFWHTWQGLEAQKFAQVISEFSKVHPEIKVEVLDSTTTEKQLVAMTGGSSFDVGLTMDYTANQWANTGALEDMTPYIEAAGTDMSNYIEPLLKLGEVDGKQYGIPFTMDTFMLFYNKDILAEAGYTEPPKTWEEFSEMCEAVTQKDENGDYTRLGCIPNYPWVTVAAIPYSFGASLYDEETNQVLAASDGVKAAMELKNSLYSGFYDNAGVQKFKSGLGQYQSAENPFFTGKVAFSIEGEWYPTFLAEYAPDLNWGVTSLPYPEGAEEQSSGFLQGGMLVIPAASKNKEAAYTFVEWLTSDEAQVALCAAKGNLPATHSGLADPALLEQNPSLEPFAEYASHAQTKALPALPFMGEYNTLMITIEEQIYSQSVTVDEALNQVTEKIQPLADEWAAAK